MIPAQRFPWPPADRAKAFRPAMRIIYMTGFAIVPSSKPGHGPLLPKPWTVDELLACIERVLAARPGETHEICY